MTSILFIYVTTPSREVAEKIAGELLADQLIACANIWEGMTSMYRWEGETQRESEVVLLLKTREEIFDQVKARVLAQHPYDCPCVVALPVKAGHADYLAWIAKETNADI